MRLLLVDSLFCTLLLDLISRSDVDPRLGEGGQLLETPWASKLLSRFVPEGGESASDEEGLLTNRIQKSGRMWRVRDPCIAT
ncbi:hypothetical protein BYT27DRAFT_7192339 [Phlegmacium glaucopus]|nr:hypothetical protein BYT27DRAFT_7192339 [Phlegmacium glaucopus]